MPGKCIRTIEGANSPPTVKKKKTNRNTLDTTALSIAFGNQGQKLPLVRNIFIFDVGFAPRLMKKFHACTIYSETGMVQANMDGVVVEPDPTVLMMMIRMVS